jgi:hypothetical protein
VVEDSAHPSRFGGLWAFIVGGGLIAALLVFLDPVTRQQDCPNYGGNGNASAFTDANWDLYLPLVMIVWIVLVIGEQVLPATWRGRTRLNVAVRAGAAVMLSLSTSCCVILPLEAICH